MRCISTPRRKGLPARTLRQADANEPRGLVPDLIAYALRPLRHCGEMPACRNVVLAWPPEGVKKKSMLLMMLMLASFVSAFSQSFFLPIPDKWNIETFPIPIEFAPQIPYSGEEHLRFSPPWGDTKSDELWSYCFLWWIKEGPKITRESLEKDLLAYYSGLVGRNIVRRKIEASKVVPTITSFQEVSTDIGDEKTFAGTVKILDYMSLRPVTLQVTVHVMPCPKQGMLGIFFAVSPQPSTHPVWKQFKLVHDGFRCEK